jgi:hypothetical protein
MLQRSKFLLQVYLEHVSVYSIGWEKKTSWPEKVKSTQILQDTKSLKKYETFFINKSKISRKFLLFFFSHEFLAAAAVALSMLFNGKKVVEHFFC